MPELPEVQSLVSFLTDNAVGRTVERCELAAFSALKTFDPPLDSLKGRTLSECTRRGKHVCLDFEHRFLVIHLARGGWLRWYASVPEKKAGLGKGPLALRVGFGEEETTATCPGFDVTEAGTEKRLALWVVDDVEQVASIAALGPDPLDPSFTVDVLAGLLASSSGNIKTALTTQSLIAGVGNAYSDEALHAARLSPFRNANRLSHDDVALLHSSLVGLLSEAVTRGEGLAAADLKGDKKRAMRVHGRTGEACPVCGDVVREVSFATKSLQYCATCQTGGKPLADRRLSRLLK